MENNLKDFIQKLIEIEKEEEKYKNIISKLKKEKDDINVNLINFLEKNKITNKEIIYGDKKIKYSLMKTQDTITKKLIEQRLKIYLNSDTKGTEATNFIYSERNSNEKAVLRITDIKNKTI